MKYLDEFRDSALVQNLAREIKKTATQPWTIMEICGGQTHTIVRYDIEHLIPSNITLIHGPGCPVCVTPLEMIDKAIAIAEQPNVILTSFGDMLRVPGSDKDLLSIKAAGSDVRMVYSPLDAVKIAEENPDKQVVFFAVGFETTAPANAMSIVEAKRRKLTNFSILCSHVLVPPAIRALLSDPESKIQGFLAAGHVCTIMGTEDYFPLVSEFNVPIVITGFEPVDILQGILMAVQQLESGIAELNNPYSRSVHPKGNLGAQAVINSVFEIANQTWRGIGEIPLSGFKIRKEWSDFDAESRFDLAHIKATESPLCHSGLILQGKLKPVDCPSFGKDCWPEHPLGAPMVSSEGACAAYFRYTRHEEKV